MKGYKTFWILLLLIFALWLWFLRETNASSVQRNPLYVPIIEYCTDYNSYCGRAFREHLDLYEWKICRDRVDNGPQTPSWCREWYSDQELGLIFDNLPGFNKMAGIK